MNRFYISRVYMLLATTCFSVGYALDEEGSRPLVASAAVSAPAVVAPSSYDRFIQNFWFSDHPKAGNIIPFLQSINALTVDKLIERAATHGSPEMLDAFMKISTGLTDNQKWILTLIRDVREKQEDVQAFFNEKYEFKYLYERKISTILDNLNFFDKSVENFDD